MHPRFRSTTALILGGLFVLLAAALAAAPGRPFLRPQVREEPTISVYMHDTGETTSMKLEEYLEGVVAAEMGSDFPPEALAAQAIIARSFTLHKIEERGGTKQIHNTDVCTDPEHFQAYDASRVTEQIKQAVRDTRGIVATFQGKPALVWFHANSGGMTATPAEGLGFDEFPVPYANPIEDPVADAKEWETSVSQAEFIRAVNETGVQVSAIDSITISEKGPSGRATKIQVGGQQVSAPELRIALGAERMRSTLLESIQTDGANVTISGKGFGHGVGLSQDGAKALAEQRKSASEIIRHYYSGLTLEKVWQ